MSGLRATFAAGAAVLAVTTPSLAAAQDTHAGHAGHVVAPPAAVEPTVVVEQQVDASAEDHSAHSAPASGDEVIGNALPPPIPLDHPSDRYFPVARMEAARSELAQMGIYNTTVMRVDMLEYRAVSGSDGYGWSGEVWTGNDYDRFVLASEGEGAFGEAPEQAELQAKWRHALDPFFNLEVGVRQDLRPDPERTYAMIGIAGDAPYWLDVEGQLFVSNKGDAHVRLEASHDWRLTQQVILQPAAEVNFAFQNVPELDIGSGFERIELGARLRYQIVPEFAPYIGVHWEQRLGRTADLARLEGERASSVAAVFGIRAWF